MQVVVADQDGVKRGRGRPRRPNRPEVDMRGIVRIIHQAVEHGAVVSVKDAAFLAQVNEESVRKAIREGHLETTPIRDSAGRVLAHEIELVKLMKYYGMNE